MHCRCMGLSMRKTLAEKEQGVGGTRGLNVSEKNKEALKSDYAATVIKLSRFPRLACKNFASTSTDR
jgi:hypothetical protein